MDKITQFYNDKKWISLTNSEKTFLQEISSKQRSTFQEIKQLIDIAIDLETWDEPGLYKTFETDDNFQKIRAHWNKLKQEPTDRTQITNEYTINEIPQKATMLKT